MKTKPLQWIDLFEPATGRTSALEVYGRQNPNVLTVTGGLNHSSGIVPKTVEDADKLIAWLKEWKEANAAPSPTESAKP